MTIDTSRPDPRVYKRAAQKVLMGVEQREAILGAVAELHPEANSTHFDGEVFKWKWEHVHQYRQSMGFLESTLPKKSRVPDSVKNAQNILVAASLELMAEVCLNPTKH